MFSRRRVIRQNTAEYEILGDEKASLAKHAITLGDNERLASLLPPSYILP